MVVKDIVIWMKSAVDMTCDDGEGNSDMDEASSRHDIQKPKIKTYCHGMVLQSF